MKKSIGKYFFPGLVLFPVTVLLAGMLSFILAKEAGCLSLDEIIAKTQRTYEKTTDLKADFTQRSTIKSTSRTECEEGIFYFKNPRMMVWDYTKPKTKKLVINLQTAWFYLPEDSAVYIQDAEGIFKSRIGIRFLSGLGKLREDFHVTFAVPDYTDREGNYLLKLIPREPDFGMEKLLVAIDKETFYINSLSFADTYGNTTQLYFRNIKINNKLPDKMFSFSPPVGVDVYNTR